MLTLVISILTKKKIKINFHKKIEMYMPSTLRLMQFLVSKIILLLKKQLSKCLLMLEKQKNSELSSIVSVNPFQMIDAGMKQNKTTFEREAIYCS